MAYKKIEQSFSFADIAIQNTADKNRILLFLKQIAKTIDREPVNKMIMKFYMTYMTGKSSECEKAYQTML